MSHQFIVDTTHVPNVRHIPVTTQRPDTDPKWLPSSQEEEAVLAHVRGWCHLSTICEVCRTESLLSDTRQTLKSVIEGPGRRLSNG